MEIEIPLTQCQAAILARKSHERGESPAVVALSFLARGVRHLDASKPCRANFSRRGVSATRKKGK